HIAITRPAGSQGTMRPSKGRGVLKRAMRAACARSNQGPCGQLVHGESSIQRPACKMHATCLTHAVSAGSHKAHAANIMGCKELASSVHLRAAALSYGQELQAAGSSSGLRTTPPRRRANNREVVLAADGFTPYTIHLRPRMGSTQSANGPEPQ
ncbi:hypothetical protein Dimus_005364, partial [Dionaea muscipula]